MYHHAPSERHLITIGQAMVVFKHPAIGCEQSVTPDVPGGGIPEVTRMIKYSKARHLVADRAVVGVDAVGAQVAVPRQVKLNDAIGGDGVEIDRRIPAVVEAAHSDVVGLENMSEAYGKAMVADVVLLLLLVVL